MPLVYLPNHRALFLWGDDRSAVPLADPAVRGRPATARVVAPGQRGPVDGVELPLVETLGCMAMVPAVDVASLPGSVAAWTLAGKLVLDLIARERVVPAVVRGNGTAQGRWMAALSDPRDVSRVAGLAAAMPPSAHAVPLGRGRTRQVWAPEALLRAFLDAAVDLLVRESCAVGAHARDGRTAAGPPHSDDHVPWEQRWLAALTGADPVFETAGFAERTLLDDLERWSRPALGARDRLRGCFRLEPPVTEDDPFLLRFLLQSPDDPSLLVGADEIWKAKGRRLARFGRAFRDPQEALLEALGRAALLFPPVAGSLAEAQPEALDLDPAAAWAFLNEGAPALVEAGFGVIIPAELTASGQRRLRLRVGGKATTTAGAVAGAAGLGLDSLIAFDWQAALGDTAISARELAALARHKAPLVRHRGQWVVVDPGELAEIQRRLAGGAESMSAREALAAALTGESRRDGPAVAVSATGMVADTVERLRESAASPASAPATLHGTLRPYQARGLAWLSTMAGLGLGACLADDMGLGKTVQLLAFLLARLESVPDDDRPALLVAPTSVLGNWEHEARRFAPALHIVHYYGPERARRSSDFPRQPGTLMITSYGLLRRDVELLSAVDWSVAVLDEAQNVKNAASATAKAARALEATHRFALTGTPVENRLAELWSIFEFCNPGLLGPLEAFRRDYALPIERYGNDEAAARLRALAAPFLLRRLKSDPAIISDLPPKNEMKVICTLTREQATLYQAVVDEEMRRIESAEGIERRGRVLALLLFLKQICNHPAQYLGESGPLPRRSGKLERATEMLEEAIAEGDRALVFTQFREMGDRLVAHLAGRLGVEVAFLHGGTPRKAREEMVRRFQEDPRGPRLFVLSVKAGGTGLNLTAASHVFHFDRWWNPAVEDQATDRAYRIGQTRAVQVHKLICAGTVEEKVDVMLEHKRDLAAKIVAGGEHWITELGNDDLRDLFSLSAGAALDDDDGEGDPARAVSPGPRRQRRTERV